MAINLSGGDASLDHYKEKPLEQQWHRAWRGLINFMIFLGNFLTTPNLLGLVLLFAIIGARCCNNN
jgi:hypothetical protein